MSSKRYLALLEEMKKLHENKSAGYVGDNPDAWANFHEAEQWGSDALTGCLIRLGDKYRRLQVISKNPSNERVDESFRETAIDLAAYALIAVCLNEEEAEANTPPPSPRERNKND